MRELKINEDSRILIIAPHPDDECIGAGGLLAKYANRCDVILLTDGRQGQGDISPAKLLEIRKQEFIEEMESLNVRSYKMMEIEDGTLISHTDCLFGVNLSNYDLIFVTGGQDDHPDHKAAFLCLKKAIESQKREDFDLKVYAFEVHTPLLKPTHFLDITDNIQRKVDLIRIHRSQNKELPYDVLAEQCAAYRGTLFRMPGKKLEVYEEIDINVNTDDIISETENLLRKERMIGWTLKRWVRALLNGSGVSDELVKKRISEVYIYGYGELGKLFLAELRGKGISVRAVIDRRAEQFTDESIRVILINETKNDIPVIITAVYECVEIEEQLRKRGFEQIYSLKSMLESI